MIGVTERAKQELKRILSANADNPLAGLRLTATGQNKLGLSIDVEAPGDTVVEQELVDRLQGIHLDVEDTPEGPKLIICEDS